MPRCELFNVAKKYLLLVLVGGTQESNIEKRIA